MLDHHVATREEWLDARKALLAEEKAFTKARDALSAKRRALPWVRIEKDYRFDTQEGVKTLGELFGPRRQLIVYHFMFAPEWEKPCKSCSFWMDSVSGLISHLEQRDTRFVAISRAPLAKLMARAKQMGWTFPWASSGESDFNYDFGVSFKPQDLQKGASYNYERLDWKASDLPGLSTFVKGDDGAVYHAYSCFSRGIDLLNDAYNYLDVSPLGRQEAAKNPMSWVRLHDEYAD